jgi:hypothetical protein
LLEITYTLSPGRQDNVYRHEDKLVVVRGASLPDACVAFGSPAYGNVVRKEFTGSPWWILLPIGLDVIALLGKRLFGKKYVFVFPFCRNCSPRNLLVRDIRIEDQVAIFKGASTGFLNLLPAAPPSLVEEINRDWIDRKFSRSR